MRLCYTCRPIYLFRTVKLQCFILFLFYLIGAANNEVSNVFRTLRNINEPSDDVISSVVSSHDYTPRSHRYIPVTRATRLPAHQYDSTNQHCCMIGVQAADHGIVCSINVQATIFLGNGHTRSSRLVQSDNDNDNDSSTSRLLLQVTSCTRHINLYYREQYQKCCVYHRAYLSTLQQCDAYLFNSQTTACRREVNRRFS